MFSKVAALLLEKRMYKKTFALIEIDIGFYGSKTVCDNKLEN